MDKIFTFNVTNITTNNTHFKLTELVEDATYYITLVAVNAVGKSHSVTIELVLNDNESEQVDYAFFISFISYTTLDLCCIGLRFKCIFNNLYICIIYCINK